MIVFHAGLFVTESNEAAAAILCSLLLICLLVCLSGVAFSALAQHMFTRFAKKYQFFLCHHKQAGDFSTVPDNSSSRLPLAGHRLPCATPEDAAPAARI